jgi:CheY-like chemotaxis protein
MSGGQALDREADIPRTSALRILLAEDNAMNQMVALRLLERLGHGADVAANGVEALAALERQPYDVVLMDMQMPEMDGLEAARQICARWPRESRPRIIAMTANAMAEDRDACLAAGMDDYVAKPVRQEELAAALARAAPLQAAEPAAPELDSAVPELDPTALTTLRDLGGDEFVTEVIDTFLADTPAEIARLREALASQEAQDLRRAAHTLKSNGATLGATHFAALCQAIEHQARDHQLDGADEAITRIEVEHQALARALGQLRTEGRV